ncbi:hypothetical protein E2562_031365 [Oryza meyeriana var. granulata]|uniref:Uncharacterized protein n=1 Tax=Oryza meyeriana var. granulata TaxID=110450 RepID=A0A6G1DQQ5_9ORYZ|nr:hypothetical protein E2562_031365 [Oryza meyeriana var. granulata]
MAVQQRRLNHDASPIHKARPRHSTMETANRRPRIPSVHPWSAGGRHHGERQQIHPLYAVYKAAQWFPSLATHRWQLNGGVSYRTLQRQRPNGGAVATAEQATQRLETAPACGGGGCSRGAWLGALTLTAPSPPSWADP